MRKENLCRHFKLHFTHYRNSLNKVHWLQTYLKQQYQLNCLFLAHWNTVFCVLERLGSWSMVNAGIEGWWYMECKHEISKIFVSLESASSDGVLLKLPCAVQLCSLYSSWVSLSCERRLLGTNESTKNTNIIQAE